MIRGISFIIIVFASATLIVTVFLFYLAIRYSMLTTGPYPLLFPVFVITLLVIFTVLNVYILGRIVMKTLRFHDKVFISQEWFTKIMVGMDEAIIVTDKAGSVTSMNGRAEELTGWTSVESIGKPIDMIFDIVNDHTKLRVESPLNIVLKNNCIAPLANHTILIKKDKTQHYIVDSAIPIHDKHSSVIGGVLIFRDITELTMSQRTLVEMEEMLNGIIENTPLLFTVKDLEGKFLHANHRFKEVFNAEDVELTGRNHTNHYHGEQAAASDRIDLQVVKLNQLIGYEQRIHHADGTVRSYQTAKFPLHNEQNEIRAVCTVYIEVTDRKKSIEMYSRLIKQEIALERGVYNGELIRSLPCMFFTLDRHSNITSFNEACEKFTGKSAEQMLGKKLDDVFAGIGSSFLKVYHEVKRTGVDKDFTVDFASHGNVYIFQVNIYRTPKGIAILLQDVTPHKQAEEKARSLTEKLETRNEELQQFAYSLSHDLRTPISRILGLVSISDVDASFKIKNKTILETIREQIIDLDNVIKDMNATIALRDAKNAYYVMFEDELVLIRKVLEHEIAEASAVITSSFQNAEGLVTVKSYLHSIMYNLLSNALKYRLPDIPLLIDLHTQRLDHFILLTVKDNGMGIDLTKSGKQLFGLYNRFHGSKIEGKGIGLHLVKTQVEFLGGRVEVQSTLGEGSMFKIFLPVQSASV
jgi:PAS domain S-box-containing protein